MSFKLSSQQMRGCSADASRLRVALAAILGNALELYDFALYGFFAAIFAKLFFSPQDLVSGLIASYGVFAVGFIARPLGALFIGYLGDTYGRKAALECSILLMCVPTVFLGLLPTYASIGVFASLLLVLIRIVQGFSVGGELVGSYAFLVESSPPEQRGLMASWSVVGSLMGKFLAISVFQIVTLCFDESQLLAGAWRLTFIVAVIFSILALYLRRGLEEVPVQLKDNSGVKGASTWTMLLEHRVSMLLVFGMTIAATVGIYVLHIYAPVYLHLQRGLPYSTAAGSTMVAIACSASAAPLAGALSDRFGRRPVLLTAGLLLFLHAYPCFWTMRFANEFSMIMAHAVLSVLLGFMYGPMAAVYMELFPPQVRQTACGIAYNACVMSFGGLSPMIITLLIRETGNPLAPAYWLGMASFLGWVAVLYTPETSDVKTAKINYKGTAAI